MESAYLDEPSEPAPVLERLLNESLISLMLMSKARAIRLQSESARLKPGFVPPSGSKGPEERLRERWAACINNRQRLQVIKDAQDEVTKLRYGGSKSARLEGTLDWKHAVAKDPRPAPRVAAIYGISPSYVRTLRRRYRSRGVLR